MTDTATWNFDGRDIEVTHLDRVLWPDDGITKGDLLEYYRTVAPVMLPHFADRPVTFQMFYGGIPGRGAYRREAPDSAPDWIRSTPYTTATDGHLTQLPLIDDAAGLIWFSNSGVIEFHLWASHVPDLAQPDRVTIDLDPGDGADFAMVLDVAEVLHDAFADLGIESCPKTSGKRGLHVFFPLAPGYDFEAVRKWVEQLAIKLAAEHPGLIAAAHGSTHSGKLVTIDHAQNSIGRNTAAPYTVRGVPGAQVSTPLTWDEVLGKSIEPGQFTIRTVPDRIGRLGDLFAPVLGTGQPLPPLS